MTYDLRLLDADDADIHGYTKKLATNARIFDADFNRKGHGGRFTICDLRWMTYDYV